MQNRYLLQIHWSPIIWCENETIGSYANKPMYIYNNNTIHMYSGITSGRVLDGELLYTKILEVNLFAFAYRLFHRDFSPINGTYCIYNF